MLMNICTYQKW